MNSRETLQGSSATVIELTWVFTLLRVLSVIVLAVIAGRVHAEVEGNCTLCHKLPGMGRYNKTESDPANRDRLIYYINNEKFGSSYHGKIRCKGCHTGVDKIPHAGAPKVDCATDCHIRDPSVNQALP